METKPGIKTSEFWLSFAVVVVAVLGASGLFGETSGWAKALDFIAAALAAMGYTTARALTKSSENKIEEAAQFNAPRVAEPAPEEPASE